MDWQFLRHSVWSSTAHRAASGDTPGEGQAVLISNYKQALHCQTHHLFACFHQSGACTPSITRAEGLRGAGGIEKPLRGERVSSTGPWEAQPLHWRKTRLEMSHDCHLPGAHGALGEDRQSRSSHRLKVPQKTYQSSTRKQHCPRTSCAPRARSPCKEGAINSG